MWSLYQLLVNAADHNGENSMLTTKWTFLYNFQEIINNNTKHNLPEILPFHAIISLLVPSDIRKKRFSKNRIQWNIPTHQFWCIFHAAQRQTWVQCERVSACNFFSFRNVFYFSSILYTLVEPGRTQSYSRKKHSYTLHFKKWKKETTFVSESLLLTYF